MKKEVSEKIAQIYVPKYGYSDLAKLPRLLSPNSFLKFKYFCIQKFWTSQPSFKFTDKLIDKTITTINTSQLLLKINGTLDPLKHPHDHPLQYGVYFLPPTSPRWEQKLVEQGLL